MKDELKTEHYIQSLSTNINYHHLNSHNIWYTWKDGGEILTFTRYKSACSVAFTEASVSCLHPAVLEIWLALPQTTCLLILSAYIILVTKCVLLYWKHSVEMSEPGSSWWISCSYKHSDNFACAFHDSFQTTWARKYRKSTRCLGNISSRGSVACHETAGLGGWSSFSPLLWVPGHNLRTSIRTACMQGVWRGATSKLCDPASIWHRALLEAKAIWNKHVLNLKENTLKFFCVALLLIKWYTLQQLFPAKSSPLCIWPLQLLIFSLQCHRKQKVTVKAENRVYSLITLWLPSHESQKSLTFQLPKMCPAKTFCRNLYGSIKRSKSFYLSVYIKYKPTFYRYQLIN